MPAHPADDLAAWLSAVIPPAARQHARPLAQLISAVAAGNALPAALQAYLDADRQSAAGTIAALAGQSFTAGNTTVSFGSGLTAAGRNYLRAAPAL